MAYQAQEQQAESNRKFVKSHGKKVKVKGKWIWKWDMSPMEFGKALGVNDRTIRQYKADVARDRIDGRVNTTLMESKGGVNSLLSRIKNEQPLRKIRTVEKKTIHVGEKLERMLFIPDCHVPYHDVLAFELMMKVAKDFKPDHVVILGDFIDMYSVSSHDKNPKRVSQMNDEVVKANEELWRIKGLGAKNNVFIAGNHEDRLNRYLIQKAPSLYDSISIPSVLGLDKVGFEYVPYRSHYQLGKIYITHDTGKAGVYSHKQALDAFHRSIVIGHTHRFGMIIQGDANGDKHVGAMFGWLGDVKQVDYMHNINAIKDWTLGFGLGYMNPKNGYVYLQPVPIVRYSCVVDGKLYES